MKNHAYCANSPRSVGIAKIAANVTSPEKHGGHRALADILESIQELEYYRRVLFPSEPVTTERAREVAREVVALGIPTMGEQAEA